MANSKASIDEAHAAFVDARWWAQGAGTRTLRRKVRRLRRCDRDFYSPDFARLTAMRHEDRGVAS